MKVVVASEVSVQDPNSGIQLRTGSIDTQRLLDDDAPDGLNFWLVRNCFANSAAEAFKTPRHHHPFAQIKMVEKGSSNVYPGKDIEEGDIAYFPRAAYYGPQAKDNCTSFGIQFGFDGQHQRGKRWEDRRAEAMANLMKRGTIESGIFFGKDADTGEDIRQDSIEALYQERMRLVTNRPLVVEPEGYDSVILMHPKAFPYFPVSPGVSMKHLGRFYDQPGPNGDVGISMVQLSGGGRYALDGDRAQLGWTMKDGLTVDGRDYPALTSFYSPRGEHAEIAGVADVEVYLVTFPRLD
jgi:hypothetical protein